MNQVTYIQGFLIAFLSTETLIAIMGYISFMSTYDMFSMIRSCDSPIIDSINNLIYGVSQYYGLYCIDFKKYWDWGSWITKILIIIQSIIHLFLVLLVHIIIYVTISIVKGLGKFMRFAFLAIFKNHKDL